MIPGVQIVKDGAGAPVAAVLPWNEYARLAALDGEKAEEVGNIPHDVVSMVMDGDSPIKAWRRYLNLTQAQAAEKIGVSQSAFAQMEKAQNSQEATLRKAATAFGIDFDQIDMV